MPKTPNDKSIHDITGSVKIIKDRFNAEHLQSLKTHGIISLKDIEGNAEGLIVNYVVGTQRIQGNVCLNHLDLSSCSAGVKRDAIKVSVYEEYTGIMGISLERSFSSQN